VNRTIVACQASVIRGFCRKLPCSLQVAGSALFFQDGVRFAHASAGINTRIFPGAVPKDPNYCQQWHKRAQQKFYALEGRRPLEIIEVDALRQFFSGASSRHLGAFSASC
jgi:hypothetical protein